MSTIELPGQPLSNERRRVLVDSGIRGEYLDDPESLIREVCGQDDLDGMLNQPFSWVTGQNGGNPKGLLFGWRDAAGAVRWQHRPDAPPVDGKGRPKKYLFVKNGAPRYGIRSDAGDKSTVWIVEGTKQAHAVASYLGDEVTVIGIPGVTAWSGGGDDRWNLPPEVIRLCAGRDVYALPDADAGENPNVYGALEKLAKAVGPAAKSVRFIPCPGGGSQGVDDYLAVFDTDEERADILRKLPDSAYHKPAKRRPPARLRRDEKQQAREEQEAARAESIDTVMTAFGEGRAATDESGARRVSDGSVWMRDGGGLAVADLGTAILESPTPVATTPSGVVSVYVRKGVYVVTERALTAVSAGVLGNHFTPSNSSTLGQWLDATCDQENRILPVGQTGKPFINFRNGMLHIDTLELHPHDPKYMSTRQVPCDWNPAATCPTYVSWLADRVGEKQVGVLEEAISQFLDESRTPTKGLFLFGPSRSGKSTMLSIAEAMVGDPELVAALSLQQLGKDHFASAELYGKALNIAGDLPKGHIEDLSVFKQALGEDPITANRKYGRMFTFKNTAAFLMSANTVPTVSEESSAYLNRIVPVSFPKTYQGKEDPTVKDAILAELPGIAVRWVLARRAHRARRYRWLQPHPAVSAAFGQASDRVARFVSDCCIVGGQSSARPGREGTDFGGAGGWRTGLVAPLSDCHEAFKSWCHDESSRTMGRSTFRNRLEVQTGFAWVRDPLSSDSRATNLVIKPRAQWGATRWSFDSTDDLIRVLFPGASATTGRAATPPDTHQDDGVVVPMPQQPVRRSRSLFQSTYAQGT
ncbi:phage/plasmid primase, P4 family, C-terminal domain [Mycobacteroides abscessus subsp. massiliense]|uniref:phage/plasmid primase, P4 family n=1 Tax=Mycobacteroides abscessus TaxID=36809 RepID=UPI0009A7340E|nr:phage/plasmid primase, P4 family [Mycobacteroides abscessus]SLI45146.1 phage/plasmid primase, P4 family, C-terminal domain [Mycobacteroides abscessus subsp. massiliense]